VPAGKVTQEVRFQGAHRPLAGSGAAGWLLTNGPRDEEKVVVWRWPQADKAPEPAYRLSLATDFNSVFARQISRAWVHRGRAILQTEGKRVVVWDLEKKQLENSWEGYKAAVSPGGRYLAFTTDKGIALVDLTSGKQLGFWTLGSLSVSTMEFSPQGTSLAVLLQSELKVLDLTTGKMRFDNALPQGAGSTTLGPPRWCSENMVMIGRQHLVDLERGFVAWQYVTRGGVFGVPMLERIGGKLCYLSEHHGLNPASIVSLDLPHGAVVEALNGINPAELFALAPGGAVSLQVNAGAEAAPIRQAMERRIAQNGWTLAPDSPVRIVVTVKPGEAKTETYREGIGGTGAESTVTFRPMISEVDVQVNGVSAWSTSTQTSLPAVLFSTGGKSTQEAIRDYEKPSVEFFAQLPIPRQIVKPEHREGVGKSELSNTGVSEGEAKAPVRRPPPRPKSRRPR
jgi:hypothetical protein